MLGIGWQEVLVIMLVALIVVGPAKLPETAKKIGAAFFQAQRAFSEITASLKTEAALKEFQDPFKETETEIKMIQNDMKINNSVNEIAQLVNDSPSQSPTAGPEPDEPEKQ